VTLHDGDNNGDDDDGGSGGSKHSQHVLTVHVRHPTKHFI
jgi:hypothetical protein